uniref:Ig-like domain-containing protein n=1 Tax=Knipowitschia caucasica TaxID=637954 RepID=A0AAV2JK94_KNICA
MQFLGYMLDTLTSTESEAKVQMSGSASKGQTSILTIEEPSSAVYYCAASLTSPPSVLVEVGAEVSLTCSHNRSDFRVMLWFRSRPNDTALDLIGYGYNEFNNDSVEQPFKENFKLKGDLKANVKNGFLIITNAQTEDHTATYYCAAREAQRSKIPL